MAEVTLDHVGKTYPDGTVAVKDFSLEIADGELMVFVGPSGCGKTTALRMVAGLEDITEGEVRIGDRVVNALPPRDRDVAMVFQTYALYPHKSVYDNLAFPLRLRGMPKAEVEQRVKRIARLLELEEQLKRRPRQLSGGQRQRVAMGRAIVREPQAFLMDEPLSNLDAKLRVETRAGLIKLHQRLLTTTVYVTHDQTEAMTMGHRIAVLREGLLQQLDTPQTLYDRPANLFVAGFIGSPAMNFFQGQVAQADSGLDVTVGGQQIRVDEKELALHQPLGQRVGGNVIVGIRPEHLQDAALESATGNGRSLRGQVQLKELLGSEVIVHFQVEAAPAITEELIEIAQDVDAAVVDELDHQRLLRRTAFVGRFGLATTVQEDQPADIAVAPGALRFFDADTGEAIRS